MITGVRWFTGRHCIGIVQVVPDHQKEEYRQSGNFADFKYYIGVGWGEDEEVDKSYIAEWGSHFDRAAGNLMFNVVPGTPV